MKKSLVVRPEVLRKLGELPVRSRELCQDAIFALVEGFGRPHVHRGLGIRKLGPDLFECRAGLDFRVLFRDAPEALRTTFIGNHDEVLKELKSGKHD